MRKAKPPLKVLVLASCGTKHGVGTVRDKLIELPEDRNPNYEARLVGAHYFSYFDGTERNKDQVFQLLRVLYPGSKF